MLPDLSLVPTNQIPALLGELEAAKATLWARFLSEGREDTLLTIKEAARRLSCSPKHLYKQIRLGYLPGAKVGEAIRIRRSDLERAIKNRP